MDPAGRSRDPLAVALANASLLNIGYAMLGRRRWAMGTGAVTVVLIVVLALFARSVWFEIVILLWWPALISHGWHLAGGRAGRADRRQRLIALGVALPVLVAVGFLRFDGARVERTAAEAHRGGDCSRALSIMDGLGAGHRLADAPLTVRVETAGEACELLVRAGRQNDRLQAARTLETYAAHPGALWKGVEDRRADLFLAQASAELDTALTGDANALTAGFGHLSTVLTGFPGREGRVTGILDAFSARLPVEDACSTKAITDWLGRRPADGGPLDQAAGVVPRVAPAAILGCGDRFMADDEWKQAREQYKQLLARYPEHDLAAKAEDGVKKAGLAIELANVRRLTKDGDYCSHPARYSGAEAYKGNGPHRALLFGRSDHKEKLPSSWLAKDPAKATLVICAGETEYGSKVATCPYENRLSRYFPTDVTFRKKKIPVRVYELRTGKRVSPKSLQISGTFCPRTLHYTTYSGLVDISPPSKVYVKSSAANIRAAYASVIKP